MDRNEHDRVKAIFNAALKKESAEREIFLDHECGDDDELRAEIESLLSSYGESFLEDPAVENDSIKIGQKLEHYKIIKKIGEGGMGEVYLASDLKLNRKVAIKLLSKSLTADPERLNRFKQEAFTVSSLNHPYIVTIHEFGESENGNEFMVTEFVDGETLDEYCSTKAPDLSMKLDIAIQAASALLAAHEARIIHRDIKPENIIVRPDGFIKLLDFGLAKLIEPPASTGEAPVDKEAATRPHVKTATGMIMGTAPYMSPEQAKGVPVDHRTDIWSLGVVLYEMISGAKPFDAATPLETLSKVIRNEPEPISKLSAEIPTALVTTVETALAKEPDQRYNSAKDLRKDLEKVKKQIEFSVETQIGNLPATELDLHAANSGLPSNKGAWNKVILLFAGLILTATIFGFYFFFNPGNGAQLAGKTEKTTSDSAAATREIPYFLEVQKMRDGKEYGKPFRATGREIFETGYRFKMVFEKVPGGFFYIFNEGGRDTRGDSRFNMLFPSPKKNDGLAKLSNSQTVETSDNYFLSDTGTELVWVIWTSNEDPLLEKARKSALENQGVVTGGQNIVPLRNLVGKYRDTGSAVQNNDSGGRIV